MSQEERSACGMLKVISYFYATPSSSYTSSSFQAPSSAIPILFSAFSSYFYVALYGTVITDWVSCGDQMGFMVKGTYFSSGPPASSLFLSIPLTWWPPYQSLPDMKTDEVSGR